MPTFYCTRALFHVLSAYRCPHRLHTRTYYWPTPIHLLPIANKYTRRRTYIFIIFSHYRSTSIYKYKYKYKYRYLLEYAPNSSEWCRIIKRTSSINFQQLVGLGTRTVVHRYTVHVKNDKYFVLLFSVDPLRHFSTGLLKPDWAFLGSSYLRWNLKRIQHATSQIFAEWLVRTE